MLKKAIGGAAGQPKKEGLTCDSSPSSLGLDLDGDIILIAAARSGGSVELDRLPPFDAATILNLWS